MVRKIVTELNGFDNVIFEICNEPYLAGITLDWQRHIARIISSTEKSLPNRHLSPKTSPTIRGSSPTPIPRSPSSISTTPVRRSQSPRTSD